MLENRHAANGGSAGRQSFINRFGQDGDHAADLV